MRRFAATIAVIAVVTSCSAHSPNPGAQTSSSTPPVSTAATSPAPKAAELPPRCPSALRERISQTAANGGTTTLRTRRAAGLLSCTYRINHAASDVCTKVLVLINTAPSAFTNFQRWTVETGQNAMWTHTPSLNPRPVYGIGVEAEWVPGTHIFETATMTTWVAVFLTCPAHASGALHLAKELGRAGLASTS